METYAAESCGVGIGSAVQSTAEPLRKTAGVGGIAPKRHSSCEPSGAKLVPVTVTADEVRTRAYAGTTPLATGTTDGE